MHAEQLDAARVIAVDPNDLFSEAGMIPNGDL